MEVVIFEEQLKKMKKEARDVFPKECCGFLLGEKKGKKFIINEIKESENISESNFLFEMNPSEVIGAIEKHDSEFIGFYHSHPNGQSKHSSKDKKFMELWPEKVWLILGVTSRRVTEFSAYLYDEGVEELEIEN